VGVANFRQAISYAEPGTKSPMESRLRMLLVLGGLPRPQAQVSLHDRQGHFLGRPHLYYPDCRLAIEYDGGVHRDRLAEDNRRQNRLISDGIRLLRFTAGTFCGRLMPSWPRFRGCLRRTSGEGEIRTLD